MEAPKTRTQGPATRKEGSESAVRRRRGVSWIAS